MHIEENAERHSEVHQKLIITQKEKVLKTFIQWLADGTLMMEDKPSVSSFVRIIHACFKVLKTDKSKEYYKIDRIRYFIEEYLEEMGLKKKKK